MGHGWPITVQGFQYLRSISGSIARGAYRMNPFINDVVAAFGQVATHGTAIDIDRKGVSLPPGGHFQGIQRMPGEPPVLVITSSSTEKGYFVECDMEIKEHKGHARHPRTMATTAMDPPFNHAGGCQAFGHFLVAGLENSNTETNSEIQFWDFSGVPEKRPMTIPRPGSGHKHTAGAVGITSFERGTALAVATFNADTVDFLTSEADPFNGSPFKRHFTWAKDKAHKKGWIDPNSPIAPQQPSALTADHCRRQRPPGILAFMLPGNPTRLLTLVDREFRQLTELSGVATPDERGRPAVGRTHPMQ